MKKAIIVEDDNILLRSIEKEDLELLRISKNKNKQYFHHKKDITVEEQRAWFDEHKKRNDDFMFVCQDKTSKDIYGCMGFRLLENVLDGYNIMRTKDIKGTSMKDALILLVKYAKDVYPRLVFQVRVLEDNPALSWYEKIGFRRSYHQDNFFALFHESTSI
jgi:RimJ/RimL family protein N-acetyltransferase